MSMFFVEQLINKIKKIKVQGGAKRTHNCKTTIMIFISVAYTICLLQYNL